MGIKNKLKYIFYIVIVLFAKVSLGQSDSISQNKEEVYTIVEEMPEFIGGSSEMMKFIAKNIVYPLEARESGLMGKSFISFIVDTTGKVISPKILKSSGYKILDNEALKVVALMPLFKPGIQNGKKVFVVYNIPINFTISNQSENSNTRVSDEDANNLFLANENYNLGSTAYEKGNIERAIYYFKQTLKYNSADIDALYNLGVIYHKQGDDLKACEMFKEIQSFKRTDADELIKKYCSN